MAHTHTCKHTPTRLSSLSSQHEAFNSRGRGGGLGRKDEGVREAEEEEKKKEG